MFDHLRLSFNAVNMVLLSKNCVKFTKLLVQKCAQMHMFFGNDQDVGLLEHLNV